MSNSSFGNFRSFSEFGTQSLEDVSTTSPINNDVLSYDGALKKWAPKALGAGGNIVGSSSLSSTENAVVRFDGTTGQLIKGSTVTINDSGVISNVQSPVSANDATTKEYVDSLVVLGVSFIQPVKAATTTDVNLDGLQTVDGVALVAGDRVLVKDGTPANPGTLSVDNGVYVVDPGAWSRATDAPGGSSASGKTCAVDDGLENNNTIFTCNTNSADFGDPIAFVRIAGFSDIGVPSTTTDKAIVRWSGVNGNEQSNSLVSISDTGAITGARSVSLTGSVSGDVLVSPAASTTTYSLTLPAAQGSSNDVLRNDGTGNLTWQSAGDASGPASATGDALVRFDGTSGKLVKNSTVGLSDAGVMTGVRSVVLLDAAGTGLLAVQPAPATTSYTLVLPAAQAGANQFLRNDGTGLLTWQSVGDVTNSAGSVIDNSLPRFDSTTGKIIQGSSIVVDDSNNVTGVVNLGVTGRISGLSAPVSQDEAVNKSYVDNAIAGLKWKEPVRATTTANLASLSTLLTVDGITLVVGDRVLVKDQTNAVENGIYVAAAGAWARSVDLPAGSSAAGVAVFVSVGTLYANKAFVCSSESGSDTVGTDPLTFVSFIANTGSGDVSGPNSVADNTLARFDGTTGKTIQSSNIVINDSDQMSGVKSVALSGSTSGAITMQAAATTSSYAVSFPSAQGAASTFLRNDGSGALTWEAVSADVVGPASSTDNSLVRFDGTTGKLVQNSTVSVSDTADLAGLGSLAMNGSTSGTITISPAALTTSHSLTLPSAQASVGSYLYNNGTGALSWLSAGASGGGVKNIQVFNTVGSATYTPTAGTTRAVVYITGGGGAGGGALGSTDNSHGSGGNAGATVVALLEVSDSSTGTVTIGAGGSGNSGATGGNGSNSTFLYPTSGTPSATLTAGFGRGGITKTNSSNTYATLPNSTRATGSATVINAVLLAFYTMDGNFGGTSFSFAADTVIAGKGGDSFWGGGGLNAISANTNAATNGSAADPDSGSGGGGAAQTNGTNATGGAGGRGRCVIIEY